MRKTGSMIDKIILYICCLILYFSQTDYSINVVIVLIPVIFGAFLSYFESEKLRTTLTVSFSLLACFVPELIVFLPFIAYDMIDGKYQVLNLAGILPLGLSVQSPAWRTTLVVVAVAFVSLAIRFRAKEQHAMRSRYNTLLDESREMSMTMKKQNSDRIEKQDFELSNATLNERNRIAREIHDNVGHLLSSAILQSGALMTINRDERVEASLKTLKDTLDQAMNSIRTSVHQLYDTSVDLKAQIMDIADKFTFCELTCDYLIHGNPDIKIKYAFLSVVKEALSNIIRHSDATHASIVFREHPALYQLIIRDNGTVVKSRIDDGMGLKNMADRVEAFSGNINILTHNGFEIFISIPKEDIL